MGQHAEPEAVWSDGTGHKEVDAALTKSLCRLSQETQLPYTTHHAVHKRTKLLPYHLSLVQELLPVDEERCALLCMASTINGATLWYPGSHVVSDEAWFHLSGYITQNRAFVRVKKSICNPWGTILIHKKWCMVGCFLHLHHWAYFYRLHHKHRGLPVNFQCIHKPVDKWWSNYCLLPGRWSKMSHVKCSTWGKEKVF